MTSLTVCINVTSVTAQAVADAPNTVAASAENSVTVAESLTDSADTVAQTTATAPDLSVTSDVAITVAEPLETALQNTVITAIDGTLTLATAASGFWSNILEAAIASTLGAGVIALINWRFLKKEGRINRKFLAKQAARGKKYDVNKHRREIADQFCIKMEDAAIALSDSLSDEQRLTQLCKYRAYFWGFIDFAHKSTVYDHRTPKEIDEIEALLRFLIPKKEKKWLSNMLRALARLRFLLT